MQLSEVYQDAERQKAAIYSWEIGFADAATIEIGGNYAIFIDLRKCRSLNDYAWKLAHEVSHCATGCTHKLSSGFDLIEKHEYKANRRQIETYLPVEDLRAAARKGLREAWEIADELNVPQYAVEQAVHYWRDLRGEKIDPEG